MLKKPSIVLKNKHEILNKFNKLDFLMEKGE